MNTDRPVADQVWKRRRDGELVRVIHVYPGGNTGWVTIANVRGMPRRRTNYIHRFIETHERQP